MNSRNPRTRYLLRKALSHALALEKGGEDCRDMQDLLYELDGDSASLTHESTIWQMNAMARLRGDADDDADISPCRPPPLKIVPFRPVTADDEPPAA
jgi:hypothetical protein